MAMFTTQDGVSLFYKDWGGGSTAQPIMFHHGWPLTADDWGNQMLFFLRKGYRVIAHDRRGHGRSGQTDTGNEMDTYTADVAELVYKLDLKEVFHVGHSTGGREVIRYVAQSQLGRVSKVVLIGAIPPIMVATEGNPGGLPITVFDGFRTALSRNRAQFYLDIASGPFYGFNRAGAEVREGLIRNWWRQAMMGGAKAHYDCIAAVSETDLSEDLQTVSLPVLLIHAEDDQVVPIDASAHKAIKLLPNRILKTYPGLSHGLFATHPELINADLLAFFEG